MAPHLEQVPSLFQWATENKSLNQNDDMIMDDLMPDVVGSSMHPDSVPDNMAALLYDDELELLT